MRKNISLSFVLKAFVVELLLLEMGLAIWVQIMDEAVCISHHANTFVKGVPLTILSPVMEK